MASATKTPTDFNFWKDNKIDQHFVLKAHELRSRFTEWCKSQDMEMLGYLGLQNSVSKFVGEKDGLSAIGDTENSFKAYRDMEVVLKDIHAYYTKY